MKVQKRQRRTNGALDEEHFYHLEPSGIGCEDSWVHSFFAPHIRKNCLSSDTSPPIFASTKLS
jgi:hypothetical protein